MKLVRSLLDTLYKIPVVNKAEPLIEAVDAALFGTTDTTQGAPHRRQDCCPGDYGHGNRR